MTFETIRVKRTEELTRKNIGGNTKLNFFLQGFEPKKKIGKHVNYMSVSGKSNDFACIAKFDDFPSQVCLDLTTSNGSICMFILRVKRVATASLAQLARAQVSYIE